MEFQRLKKGWRVFMSPDELSVILESVPHHGCRIAILLMSLSLRREPTTQVTPDDFFKKAGVWWVEVEGKDSSPRYHETRSRDVWVPAPIMDEIISFIEEKDRDDDEPLISVQKRQLSNWIDTAVENAATRTGNDRYTRITCHDFRRFFATHFLLRLGVDDHVIMQLGGWKEIEHMYEYLLLPKDLVRRRLAQAGLLNTNPMRLSGDKSAETIQSNIDTVRKVLAESDDPKAIETLQEKLIDLASDVPSVNVTVNALDNTAGDEGGADGKQSSLPTDAVISPAAALAATGVEVGARTRNRLEREWADLTDDEADWPTPREAAQPTAEMLGSLVLMGILFASTGFSLDPIAGEVTLPSATSTAGLGSGLVGGIVRMLWIDHCTRVEEISFTKWARRKLGL
jgi:hypothetical protein